MKMPVKLAVTASLFVLSFSTIAQGSAHDIQSITTTIENYFYGYVYRDSVQLYKAFDYKNGVMKVPSKGEGGNEYVDNVYFKELLPKWSAREKLPQVVLDNSELKILNIDVAEGVIGSAKIWMKVGEDIYIDILSLQKINQQWKITNKIYLAMED